MPRTLVLFSSRTGRTAALADAIAEGASSVRFAEVDVRWLPSLASSENIEGNSRRTAIEEKLGRKDSPVEETLGRNGSPIEETLGRKDSRIEQTLARKYRPLEEVERLADYDGLIMGAPTSDGVMAAELDHLLRQAATLFGGGKLANRAGSAFTTVPAGGSGTVIRDIVAPGGAAVPPDSTGTLLRTAELGLWSIMRSMATLGMVLVPSGSAATGDTESPYGATSAREEGPDAAELVLARHQGRRVATVAAMVAHVRSHHHHH